MVTKIALYGKGGIGKSTIAANLSAALSQKDKKVLQIGCDPKHDSTRLLLGGKAIMTALDYMKSTPATIQRLDRVLHTGYNGIVCAEAGGPEPGVGCAGRGILSTFALFERLGLDMDSFDLVLYDVLGDVVCGGFAVPLRRDFADRVYVISSEEFMSIYAANNIIKGVHNFDDDGYRLAGLIVNSRGEKESQGPLRRFSALVDLPIITMVPRSEIFREAERIQQTVVEAFPDSREAAVFHALANHILDDTAVYAAKYLQEESLEQKVFGTLSGEEKRHPAIQNKTPDTLRKSCASAADGAMPPGSPSAFLSKSLLSREPLHGCAFSGAIATTTQIGGTVTVAHGPISCSYIAGQAVFSSGERTMTKEKILLEKQLAPALLSSDMDESMVIYGGREKLKATIEKAISTNPQAVFLVTTCPSGVIGDDPLAAVREIKGRYPHIPILPVTSDGNLRGDYMQGVINGCMEGAAALIDMDVKPQPLTVNILAEKNIAYNAERNFTTISDLLKRLGIKVNCRFVRNTSVEQLRHFKKAALNLPAYTDYLGRIIRDFIDERLDMKTLSLPFPVGFSETAAWLERVADFFELQDQAAQIINKEQHIYQKTVQQYRRALQGKRLMIITYIHQVDWIVESAMDLGMKVVKIGILHYSQDNLFVTRYTDSFPVELDYDPANRDDDLYALQPDLLLANYTPGDLPFPVHADIMPLCPDVGFYGGLSFAHRWATLLKAPVMEGWRHDAP